MHKVDTNWQEKIQLPSKFCHTLAPMLRPARFADFSGLPLEFACSSLRIWSKTGEALSSSCPSCSHIFLRMEVTMRLSWACRLFSFLGSSICHELVDLCILQHAEFHLAFRGLVHLNARMVGCNEKMRAPTRRWVEWKSQFGNLLLPKVEYPGETTEMNIYLKTTITK